MSLIIFDLDGTLIDSLEDLKVSINYAFRTMNIPERTTDEVRCAIGNGALRLIEELIPAAHAHRKNEAFDYFIAHYNDNCAEQTVVYDGVREYLAKVRSHAEIRTALLTNKPETPTKIILQRLGLDSFFDLVIGGDTLPKRKPDPMGIIYAMEYFNFSTEQTIMVGDSIQDIEAARNAGVKSVGITSGFGNTTVIPDWSIDCFADINQIHLFDL